MYIWMFVFKYPIGTQVVDTKGGGDVDVDDDVVQLVWTCLVASCCGFFFSS